MCYDYVAIYYYGLLVCISKTNFEAVWLWATIDQEYHLSRPISIKAFSLQYLTILLWSLTSWVLISE